MAGFKIGTTLGGMQLLNDILTPTNGVHDPDWSYRPFSASIRLADGTVKGQGFPVAVWRFNHLSNANREVLKALIPNLSATLYIHTPTNETSSGVITWDDFQAVAEWTPEDEDKAADKTLGLVITFTHMVAV